MTLSLMRPTRAGWEHTSESKFGERPLIERYGKYQRLPGSYVPFIPDSEFPSYLFGIKIRGTMDEEANRAICAKKSFIPFFNCW